MDIRKVQVTGGSSYVVTLPKEWIASQKISKNSPVGMMVQPDGTLLVTANTKEQAVQRTKDFDIDDVQSYDHLYRLLIGAYIMGYSVIMLHSKKKIPPLLRDCAIKFCQIAIGPEIVEETITSIMMKDLLNPLEMPLENTIKRMYILSRTMHEDAILALRNKDPTLAEEIVARDTDVNRLHWLIARQAHMVLRDATLSKKMGVEMQDANHYYLLSRQLERIADHSVRIAKQAILLSKEDMDPKISKTIASASDMSLKIFQNSMNAWVRKDVKEANDNIDSIKLLIARCEDINNAALKLGGQASISLSYIAESIRRTGEYSVDFSELTINHLMKG